MKLAVIFPGIGYHADKPLLYYSTKLAKACGYEIRQVAYGGFPDKVRGSKEKMQQSFELALQQTRELLQDIQFEKYEKLLFISKSVGTAVSGAYAIEKKIDPDNIFYTPVEETFQFLSGKGIVFHGTADPWARTSVVKENCERLGLPLYLTENANHSLETGDVEADLKNMQRIMEQTKAYISAPGIVR